MKKIFLMAIMIFSATCANAQLWVGGNLGYDYDSNSDYTGSEFHALSISPEIGFNLSEKLAIAFNLDYTMGKIVDGGTVNTFTINPYLRYTFAKSGIASFFLDSGIEGGIQKIKDSDSDGIFGVGIQPGVALQVSDRVCLVTKLGYLGYRHTEDRDQVGFGVNNETITFGAYYSF